MRVTNICQMINNKDFKKNLKVDRKNKKRSENKSKKIIFN